MREAKDKKKIIAVRSDSIIEARFTLSSKQNDILDMFFSQIKDDDQYEYEISVDKYKDLYNTDTSNLYRDLKNATKKFEGEGFRIINKETNEEIYFAWFSKIHYIPNEGKIKFNIDRDLKKLLYEVRKKVYYDISYTLNFSSSYSQRMYYYLKSFEDTGWRKDKIEDLQKKLDCPRTYKNFANLKKYVLEVAKSEINANSDILFDYEIEFEGRKAKYIMYKIKKKDSIDLAIEQIETVVDDSNSSNLTKDFILEVANEQSFSYSEINRILTASKAGFLKQENVGNEKDYFKKQFKIANDYYNIKREGELVAVLISSLRNCWTSNKNYKNKSVEKTNNIKQTSIFHNFEQRTYDYDKLERELLGWDEVI